MHFIIFFSFNKQFFVPAYPMRGRYHGAAAFLTIPVLSPN